ncbi:MAG: chorismate synthase [Clostridia bacterium]|nr:chorismate synthase [Clostridia bacterium]
MRFQGKKLTVQVFGQSHGEAIGAVIDGLPAGVRVDQERLNALMRRRAPGQGAHTTARREPDIPEFVSGLADGISCGAPVTVLIRNRDARSGDYASLRDIPRPSHADWPAFVKYGPAHDGRGGGVFSGRLTAPLCAAGAIALQMLADRQVFVGAHIAEIAGIPDDPFDPVGLKPEDLAAPGQKSFPVCSDGAGAEMLSAIEDARRDGDSVGGVVECASLGLPVGLGGPLFEGLESALASALFAIPAVRGVSFGKGFEAARMRGSAHNDPLLVADGRIVTSTNRAGGLQGGMTNGMPLLVNVAFKPTPSIALPQRSVSLSRMQPAELIISGRHDPCVVPRAVPVVESMVALVLLDQLL